jgi:plasma-membrane proton-efflux P-type ATPase
MDSPALTSASAIREEEVSSSPGDDHPGGLGDLEVETLRKRHGYNEVVAAKDHPLLAFLGKFWGPSAWMLELIMVVSLVLGKFSDLAIVGALLVLNAVINVAQERRAAGAVEALQKRLKVNARVLRDGKWQMLPSRDLVPGDRVRLRPGDLMPADLRLLEGLLSIDQSTTTGESTDADKAPGDILSAGSVLRRGEGEAVVTLTGAMSSLGRTTKLVQEARPKLHIDAVVAKMVRWLFLITGSLVAGLIALSLLRGTPVLGILPLMLILLMSAIPLSLPVMFTVSMALGSRELARHGVLVTRLSAVEDAATMDLLCVDKTGTITMNRLAVAGLVPAGGATAADILLAGGLASEEADQDPIDMALLAAAREGHVLDGIAIGPPLSFVPFDAQNRRTEAVIDLGGVRTRVMKGAVRTVAEACGLKAEAVAALEAKVEAAAQKGQRTLAVARGPEAGVPTLLGLVLLYDPPRPDAGKLIATLRDLGISVKMLTGDALPIAREVAEAVGLVDIRQVAELKAAIGSSDRELTALLDEADGFAEVFPADKDLVVRRLQAEGHVTGMTGDGVNDAPALRQAEVGIAVSSATDVAKKAASVILTDPGLSNIVTLVEEGRSIYQRILTWIINKISRTVLKAAFVALSFVATGKFVVTAFAMLLLVFMTDFAKIALATDTVRPSQRPETWKIGGIALVAVASGLAMLAESLLLLWIGWSHFGLSTDDAALSTFSFLTLLYFAAFSIVSARERGHFWTTAPGKSLVAALVADTVIGTLLTRIGLPGLVPLPWPETLCILGFAMVSCLGLNDALKVALMRRVRRVRPPA